MRRMILWIILSGVALIAVVIVVQLLGTYVFLRSPAQVVNGAMSRLITAKTFDFAMEAADDAKDGLSFNISGPIDKQVLTRPAVDLKFSFQAAGQTFYGTGQIVAKDGEIYLRFDQIAGLPGVLPGALQSLWAGLGVEPLLAVAQDRLFPDVAGNFTEADLQSIAAMAQKNIPFSTSGQGKQLFIDNVLVVPYGVALDRPVLTTLIIEIKEAVKGAPLDTNERAEVAQLVAGLPPVTGQVWVGKKDGALRAVVLVVKGSESSFHLNLRFSNYDKSVRVDPPVGAQPLVELFRRLFGTSLSGVKVKLPFDLPLPIVDVNMPLPTVPTASPSGSKEENLGGLPNLLRLFYGTDDLFAPETVK